MLTQIFKSYELDHVNALLAQVANSNDSVFLSQLWLIPWLKTLPKKPLLMVCKRDTHILGLAFWGCQQHWLGDRYYLNQTGVHSEDQVWIEQNDIICRPDDRPAVLEAMLQKLSELKNFAKVTAQTCLSDQWQHARYLEPEITSETNFYAGLKMPSNYLDSLSKNTRASIRRSNKLIEDKFGPISVTIAQQIEHHGEPANMAVALPIQRLCNSMNSYWAQVITNTQTRLNYSRSQQAISSLGIYTF
jgi:hypothetical protein